MEPPKLSAPDRSDDRETVPGYARGDRLFIVVVFPLLGLLIGAGIHPLAEWASGVDALPFGRFSDLVAKLDPWWAQATVAAVGLLAGAAFATYALLETVTVRIGPDQLQLKRGDATWSIARADVDAVFVESKQIIVLDQHTAEFARKPFEGDQELLATSLTKLGYPWSDGDPHAASYRRWIDESPDLADTEHFILRTRAKALSSGDSDEADDLRAELSRVGLVVRDEGHRQYWRRTQ